MTNWKHYAGSVLLAGLLLQGCSNDATEESTPVVEKSDAAKAAQSTANTLLAISTAEDTPSAKLAMSVSGLETSDNAEAFIKDALAQLVANDIITQAEADEFAAGNDLNQVFLDTYALKTPGVLASPSRNIVSDIGDTLKNGLVDIMDSTVGDALTGAAFDVVLNSDGVTVFMLDMARDSETMTQIMIDALDANWDLTAKMCPMLQTNAEFGEKFAALTWERKSMADFFFVAVDAPMYGCLTDAMLLSNNDAVHHADVEHSTNAYMGMLLEKYSTTYFIMPDNATNPQGYGSTFKFASLMMDNGENVVYDSEAKTFENHGDGNELISEQFFYSLFKTPGTTDAFVAAMGQLDQNVTTMFMDKIFLGAPGASDVDDTTQGYLNIISIGSAMYDGIYGEKNAEGVRVNAYGFGAYTDAFMGFAGLIPADRYFTYGKAFTNAGYAYASYNGISVWDGAVEGAQALWDNATGTDSSTSETTTEVASAPSRSAGLGVIDSKWIGDITDLFTAAWGHISLTEIYNAIADEDATVIGEIKNQANVAYSTVLDGRNDAGEKAYATTISNGLVRNDTVYGFHGLIELATQEDIYFVNCGNRSTDYIDGQIVICDNNNSYDIDDAKAAFTLPPFAEITWSFAYNSAKDGAVAYYNNFVDAGWLADLSDNELIRAYFYPSADNVYIPSWLLAIDWLKFPDNFNNAEITTTDFNFDGGYMDIYVVSPNDALLKPTETVAEGDIDLTTIAGLVKTIEITAIDMSSDSIIAVDESGQTLDGLYVYKVRTITPEDTAAVMAYLSGLGDSALSAIGIDSDNATQTVAAE